MMEEDLVTVGAWGDTHYITVGFAAHPFGWMRFLEQLNHTDKRNIYLCRFSYMLSRFFL